MMIKGIVMLSCACNMGNYQSEVYLIFVSLYGAVYLWKMKVLEADRQTDRFPGALFSCPLVGVRCVQDMWKCSGHQCIESPLFPLFLGLRKAKVLLYLLLPGVLYIGWDLYWTHIHFPDSYSEIISIKCLESSLTLQAKTLRSNCGICSYYLKNCSVQPELEKLVLDAALYGRMGRSSLCSTPNNESNLKPYVCGRAAAVASACVTWDTRSQ